MEAVDEIKIVIMIIKNTLKAVGRFMSFIFRFTNDLLKLISLSNDDLWVFPIITFTRNNTTNISVLIIVYLTYYF